MVQASDPPVPPLVDALYTVVRRAHRLRNRRIHTSCDKAGLALLSHLIEQGPMRLSDLASSAQLDPSTVSRQVRALCDGGFARAIDDPDDKRARLLEISDSGREEVTSVGRQVGEVLARAMADWSKSDVDKLTALLAKLADDLLIYGQAGTAQPQTMKPQENAR
jgi:DNA-binding MarR family transcriptional regulator